MKKTETLYQVLFTDKDKIERISPYTMSRVDLAKSIADELFSKSDILEVRIVKIEFVKKYTEISLQKK